ncbi:MAG TPA: glycosyltransferase [Candidatus Omnitrophota bacterium]|mgnify:CR=1 FL=1|nr:glycosyltransferase [Candidatus Omnitrophota bacterium]
MNILFLISQLPYPLDTGAKIRSFNLIKALGSLHKITLVSFGDEWVEKEKVEALHKICEKVVLVKKDIASSAFGRLAMTALALKNLFSKYPYSVDKYYSSALSARLKELVAKCGFDLVHCDSLQMSRNLSGIKGVPAVLTEHNIESQILKRAAESEMNILKKAYLYYQYKKLLKYEKAACGWFDRVVTVSEEDKRFLAQYARGDKISVVPNGVDTGYFKPITDNQKSITDNAIVFTGSMDWLPNEDAVSYFYDEIYPYIKANVKLYVVGRNPSNKMLQIAEKDVRLVVTGTVDDVRPYVADADIFIVPLRIGGGTRLKILEAMAMGKAVISTSVGCEGLEVTDGVDIIIEDDPRLFAGKIDALMSDTDTRKRLGLAGRRLVETKYDWKSISKTLDAAWVSTTGGSQIPCLLYHDIREDTADMTGARPELVPYILRKTHFETHMKWLAESGYHVSGCQVTKSQSDKAASKKIILAFDDGWKSNYEIAYPILKRYGFSATFFVTIENIGKPDMMTWKDIKEMADNGMEIGSHNMTHRIPVELWDDELEVEMRESKRVLEEKLGRAVRSFSLPTGFYDKRMAKLARKTGYEIACYSRVELNSIKGGEEFLTLKKIGIKRGFDLELFNGIAKGDPNVLAKLRKGQTVRNLAKSVLGSGGYNIIKDLVMRRS